MCVILGAIAAAILLLVGVLLGAGAGHRRRGGFRLGRRQGELGFRSRHPRLGQLELSLQLLDLRRRASLLAQGIAAAKDESKGQTNQGICTPSPGFAKERVTSQVSTLETTSITRPSSK